VVERELRAIDVHPTNLHQLSYQYGPTFLKNAFSTLLNQCHVELRQLKLRQLELSIYILTIAGGQQVHFVPR